MREPRYPLPRVVLDNERRQCHEHAHRFRGGRARSVKLPWRGPRGFVLCEGARAGAIDPTAEGDRGACAPVLPPMIKTGSVDFSRRRRQRTARVAAIRTLHRTIQSVGATGGVYKGQGRSQRER
ncbi:hypothetical protein LWI29_038114 [Acer saccharum]|uniref:Uncharacterized protein n=1 Tax=Acer saccharum TaxID=4024 RepID=A0AA39SQ49_ACESA|nr:hypothetical protein LWI29_038114 [Acer saccharum]